MLPDELIELQEQFKQTNHLDPIQLQAWFADHAELTAAEHAMVMDRSKIRIDHLRQSLGLNSIVFTETNEGILYLEQDKSKPIPALPQIGTDLWVVEQYQNGKSIKELSLALGKSRTHIRTILRNRKIERRNKTTNPFQNKEWLIEHYINQELTMKECGKLAGVVGSTIYTWLAKFKIPCRDNFEAINAGMGKKASKTVGSSSNSRPDTPKV